MLSEVSGGSSSSALTKHGEELKKAGKLPSNISSSSSSSGSLRSDPNMANLPSYNKFEDTVKISDYSAKTAGYKNSADSQYKSISAADVNVVNNKAAFNPAFYDSYDKMVASDNLEFFYKQQELFWKAEESYIKNNPKALTRGREGTYNQIKALETQYEKAVLSRDLVTAGKLKGQLDDLKYQIQSTQTA